MAVKKIAFFIPRFTCGGAERVVSRMISVLKEEYEVCLILYDDKEMGYSADCEVISLDTPFQDMPLYKKVYYTIVKRKKLKQILKQKQIDVCFSFGDSTNVILLLQSLKVKKVISLRGYARIRKPENYRNTYFYIPLLSYLYKRADRIVCVSEVMRREILEGYATDPEKTVTLYNAFHIQEIEKKSMEKLMEEDEVLFKEKRVLLSVGTLRYPKGYWHLIRIFAEIHKKVPDTFLMIIGKDHAGNKEKLLSLSKCLNIKENIVIRDFDENPFKYMKRSCLYLLSSISEGFPNAMVEAMICGLPIIAADCKTGPREILNPSDIYAACTELTYAEYGIMVPPFEGKEIYDNRELSASEQHMVSAALELLSDEEKRKRYCLLAQERVLAFSNEYWKRELKEIIEK